jgi:hypothetical protein
LARHKGSREEGLFAKPHRHIEENAERVVINTTNIRLPRRIGGAIQRA